MTTCDQVQDRLPDLAAGRLDPAESTGARLHLESCDDCRAALEVVELLASAPPRAVPTGLEARIAQAVRREVLEAPTAGPAARRRFQAPRWALAAAAGLALAVATPVLMERMGPASTEVIDETEVTAMLTESLPSPWFSDEGTVAGAPVLDDLSDDALLRLLEEME